MQNALAGILIFLLSGIFFSLLWLILSRRGRQSETDARLIQSEYQALRAELNNSLSSSLNLINTQLGNQNRKISEELSAVSYLFQNATGQIGQRMDASARVSGELRERLGELSKATQHLIEVGKDISGLQEILASPKARGGFGEFLLAELLAQCLPRANYELQYAFRSGMRVDAAIRLGNRLVPVDAKFPLENFRKISSNDDESGVARKKFLADCRKHVDAIASSYIRPEEGTFSFAFMYIPAEGVYHEAVLKDYEGCEPLSSYAFSRKVIPVSPNSFYAYLQTILLGLKGFEVNERAGQVLAHMEGLAHEFGRLGGELEVLGRHIANSGTKYNEVQKRAERFSALLSGANFPALLTDEEKQAEQAK